MLKRSYYSPQYFRILVFAFIVLFATGCNKTKNISTNSKESFNKPSTLEPIAYDLDEIKESGVLRAITTFSPTGYFLYKGQAMGFEYEMLHRLAKSIGVDLEIVLAKNVDSVIPMLNRGDGDIIALGFTIMGNRKEEISFTDPYLITYQSLVQKKPDNWRKISRDNVKKKLATDIVDLIRDTVSVRKNTSYYDRLSKLSNELGDTIYINVLPGEFTDEEIIKMVADGKIKYTVIDNNIAEINKSYYPNIDTDTQISLSQRIAWAVRKNSPELLIKMNDKLRLLKNTATYNIIYNKYFKNRSQFNKRLGSQFYTESTGKISKYDNLVKKYTADMGWDWRLVKALMYQESRFKVDGKSWAGASGLMQLMPSTAKALGVTDIHDPEQNIKAGITFLKRMYKNWEDIPDSIQRIKFSMASYNAGYGHVQDAQKLTKNYKGNELVWDNGVDKYILNLSKVKYYNDPVVKYGYVRGSEPYNYIIEIFNRYEHYKEFAKE